MKKKRINGDVESAKNLLLLFTISINRMWANIKANVLLFYDF